MAEQLMLYLVIGGLLLLAYLLGREVDKLKAEVDKFLYPAPQVLWRYGDDRCAACSANNWSPCGHRGEP